MAGFQSWVRAACSGEGCPSNSALVAATTIFHQIVLCLDAAIILANYSCVTVEQGFELEDI